MRASASAAIVPSTVAMIAFRIAILKLTTMSEV